MDAALIILSMGRDAVPSPTNPHRGSRSEFGDITFGSKNLLSLLAQASLLAQKTSYYYKMAGAPPRPSRNLRRPHRGSSHRPQVLRLTPGNSRLRRPSAVEIGVRLVAAAASLSRGLPHASLLRSVPGRAPRCSRRFSTRILLLRILWRRRLPEHDWKSGAVRRSPWVVRSTSSRPTSLSPVTRRALPLRQHSRASGRRGSSDRSTD